MDAAAYEAAAVARRPPWTRASAAWAHVLGSGHVDPAALSCVALTCRAGRVAAACSFAPTEPPTAMNFQASCLVRRATATHLAAAAADTLTARGAFSVRAPHAARVRHIAALVALARALAEAAALPRAACGTPLNAFVDAYWVRPCAAGVAQADVPAAVLASLAADGEKPTAARRIVEWLHGWCAEQHTHTEASASVAPAVGTKRPRDAPHLLRHVPLARTPWVVLLQRGAHTAGVVDTRWQPQRAWVYRRAAAVLAPPLAAAAAATEAAAAATGAAMSDA